MSLSLKNVSRTFAGKTVVKNISFATKPGVIVGILGTSGSGKSTLLRAISGLDQDYEGEITVLGKLTQGVHEKIGFIFQEPRLLPWLTVIENVVFGLRGNKQEKIVRARQYLQNVGLQNCEYLYPRQLSGGMAQRVAIARALVTSPEILLLDEPFSALDAFTKMQLQDLLLKIWEMYQSTFILVTHDVDEALYLCDRVIILRGQPGKIAEEITIHEPKPRQRGSQTLAHLKAKILDSLELEQMNVLQL